MHGMFTGRVITFKCFHSGFVKFPRYVARDVISGRTLSPYFRAINVKFMIILSYTLLSNVILMFSCAAMSGIADRYGVMGKLVS